MHLPGSLIQSLTDFGSINHLKSPSYDSRFAMGDAYSNRNNEDYEEDYEEEDFKGDGSGRSSIRKLSTFRGSSGGLKSSSRGSPRK